MSKPHYKLTASGPQLATPAVPRVGAVAHMAASPSHPDLRAWWPNAGSADADINPELGLMRARSRDLTRNHGVADGARQTYLDNIVGCGLRLAAKPDWRVLKRDRVWAEEWANTVQAHWALYWGNRGCDAGETLVGDGLTAQIFNSAFLNGEGLALPLWLPDRGYRHATCFQVIEPDRLSNPHGQPDTATLRGGVEINTYGKPLAYWIQSAHPGDAMFTGGGISEWQRIPATTEWGRARVVHLHDRERSGQSRGKPSLASVMRQFKVLGDFTNAELKAAVANALVAIIVESNLSQESIVELFSSNPAALETYQAGLAQRGRASIDFMGAQIVPVPLGDKVSSFSPARPSTSFEPFVTTLFRHMAAGLHIPYELLLKDFSKTNYSSARAALLEAYRFFKGRRKWLSTYWASPDYRLWLEEVVNAGLVDAPDFYEHWEAYCRCTWIGDGRGWVDPLKEGKAAELRMQLNLTTLQDECAEQGGDWEENLEQRARELQRMKELETQYSITFPSQSATAPANVAVDPSLDPEADPDQQTPQEQRAAAGAVA